MSTNLEDAFSSIDLRWTEINKLIAKAEEIQETDVDLYDTLCRSTTVLLSAHFEGILKDIVQGLINDINANYDFQDIPETLKRNFVMQFINCEQKNADTRINKLRESFDGTNIKLNCEPFIKDNKNPKASIIKSITKKFGVEDFFGFIADSELDILFENNKTESIEFYDRLHKDVMKNISAFPYYPNYESYKIAKRTKAKKSSSTLYEEFLEDFLMKRHSIVHGSDLTNQTNVSNLRDIKLKLQVLVLGVIVVISHTLFKT